MYLICLVYVENYIYYVSVFHVSISSLIYKANIIDSKIIMVNIYGQDTIKAQWEMLLQPSRNF